MRKTLLAGASLAVLITASNALAADYTGDVQTTAGQTFYIEKGSNIHDATFNVKSQGNEHTANRVSMGSYDEDTTITVKGDNVIKDFLTMEQGQNDAKTTLAGNGNLAVEGYMTSTRNANVDLSGVNLTLKKAGYDAGVSKGDGALVLDNDTTAFKVGNVNFEDGTRISLYKAQAGENGTEASGDASNMLIAAGKTVRFEGNNKIAPSSGAYAKKEFNIIGEKGSKVNVNGLVDVKIDANIDGADVNITNTADNKPARLELEAGKTLTIANSTVNMDGAPNGDFNGIGNHAGDGNVVLDKTTANITNGAGIGATNLTIKEGSVVNASGKMAVHNPATAEWTSGSILQGLEKVEIAEGATVNISDGAQIVAGYPGGEIDISGTVNMSGQDALIRASSKQDGTEVSTLNVSGIVNVLKDSAGIIASRVSNILADGVVNVAQGSALNLIQDMDRLPKKDGTNDGKPTGVNAKFNVAGALVNNGTINAEKTDIKINGAALSTAPDFADQAEGGKYISNSGTLNGNLTLTGVNNPDKKDTAEKTAAILTAAPKADFYGANTINGEVSNTLGLITVNNGASLTVKNNTNDKLTNNGIIDLAGSLNANVDGAGQISVKSSAAHVTSFDGNDLEIGANTSSSSLVDEASTANQIYVSEGIEFNIDNDKIATGDLVTYGTTKLGTDYSSLKTKIAGNGTMDLGSHALTGDVTMWDNATLAFNVDQTAHDAVLQEGGKVIGAIETHLKADDSATIKPVIGLAVENGTYQYADSITNKEGDLNLKLNNGNMLYDVAFQNGSEHVLDIQKKDSGTVAGEVINAGGNATNANTLNAWVGGNSNAAALDGASQAMAEHLNTLAQTNPQELINATTALAPETAAMVQSATTENANQIFGAVGTRLSGGSISTGGEGMSSGDGFFHKGATWVQGLFNKSKLDDTRKTKGFDADSQGIALGAEKYINDDVKLGVGYAYTSTDIDGFMRETDADTHTAIVYGEYRPSQWYVNAIATYGWSDYKENKNVAGMRVNADYDVDSIGFQAMTGYDMNVMGATFTPEAGLRYVNIKQDSYRDSVGQKVSENNSDILTGVIGAKLKKDFALANGMSLRPEARFALTYDMVNDPSSSVVTLANGSAYTANGEALDRFGMEVGAGLTTDVNNDVELSLGYEGKFRDHYEDHTGLINAKYKF